MRKLVGVLALCACGGGGVASYTSTTTKSRACTDAADVLCAKLVECGWFPSADRGACETSFLAGCCVDNGKCGEPVASPGGAADCVNRLPREACSAFGTAQSLVVPGYCR